MDAELIDIEVDPLKRARIELTHRQIRREDLGMAIAERQLIREEEHRESLGQVIGAMVTFLDTLPDRLERTLSLPSPIVQALRQAVDGERDNLYEALMEMERNRRGQKTISVAIQNIAPKSASGQTVSQGKRKRGRPTNAERMARMSMS
jgi:hypothetical protein